MRVEKKNGSRVAVSETVASVLLILITLMAMGYAYYYFLREYYVDRAGISSSVEKSIISSGKIIVTLNVYSNSSYYVYYFEDVGNFLVRVSNILLYNPKTGKLSPLTGTYYICNYSQGYNSINKQQVTFPLTIYPRVIYWLVVPIGASGGITQNTGGILYLNISGVYIRLVG
ncbi:hypothetical protein HS7_12780 [Sulfolobales archaeon HS-7]|nr:hypothetical protein HS7_12780 [Sulfolobales archaeon HS-7]